MKFYAHQWILYSTLRHWCSKGKHALSYMPSIVSCYSVILPPSSCQNNRLNLTPNSVPNTLFEKKNTNSHQNFISSAWPGHLQCRKQGLSGMVPKMFGPRTPVPAWGSVQFNQVFIDVSTLAHHTPVDVEA